MVDLVHFGYFFFPSTYRPPLGHAAFDAYLSSPRTDWYFDTQAATFTVATDEAIRQVKNRASVDAGSATAAGCLRTFLPHRS